MSRGHAVLVALLAAQLVALAVIHNPFAGGRGGAARPLLPALASISPVRVAIEDGEGASLVLERRGENWVLPAAADYPAAAEEVRSLIRDLEGLVARRAVVSSARHHAALKVAPGDFERRVRVWAQPSGDPGEELFVGTSPSMRVSHVRRGGEDRVYEASDFGPADLSVDPGAWARRDLIALPPDSVGGLEISNRHGRFEIERSEGRWVVRAPASRSVGAVDQEKAAALVRSLCLLTLAAPAGRLDEAAQGFAPPAATAAFRRIGGTGPEAVLRIGGEVPGTDGRHFASVSGSAHAVAIDRYESGRLLDQTLDDLLAR